MTIGEKIREKRKHCGLSMAELGKRIGVTAAAISRYELGQRVVTVETAQAIATALGIHIFDLVAEDAVNEILTRYDIKATDASGNEVLVPTDPRVLYDTLTDSNKHKFWVKLGVMKDKEMQEGAADISATPPDSLLPDERYFIESYRSLNSEGKDLIRRQMELLLDSKRYTENPVTQTRVTEQK